MRARTIQTALEPPHVLKEALRLRMADYDIDDDGFAVSEQIWRFSRHVNPHTDDQTSDYVIVGFVFDANGHKLVHGDQALVLNPGDIYVLNPLERHGVLAPDHMATLTLYIQPMKSDKAEDLVPALFAMEAIRAAEQLVKSPPPANEML